jgi:two-component system, cell cycle sensor histidine kinase and response regulator CckA
VRARRIALLVVVVGFVASVVGYLAHQFPWVSFLIGLVATVAVATLLDLVSRRRDEAFNLVGQLEVKNMQLDEALTRQAQAEQSLRQAQRMEAVGQLAGGIAHDFNNLLQAILSYSEFLADGLDAESDLQQDVAEVQKAARRAAGLTRQLLVFSRQHVVQPAEVDLNAAVRSAEHLLRATLGEEVELICRTADAPHLVLADTGELELMVTNLVINARDAMPYGGAISITVDTIDIDAPLDAVQPGRYARIDIKDDGEGMTPEVAAKAFEPFFTTKETGRGAGLGLAMVYGIASRAGGSAAISTMVGVGTTVTVLLPLTGADPFVENDHTAGPSQSHRRALSLQMAEPLPVAR